MSEHLFKRIIKKNVSGGFTLSEMLYTVIILMLASSGMVAGVALATRNFDKSVRLSESKVLYSTLTEAINYDLRNTTAAFFASGDDGEVTGYLSPGYRTEKTKGDAGLIFFSMDEAGNKADKGYIVIGVEGAGKDNVEYVVSKAAYPRGLKASVTDLAFNRSGNYFSYTLTIYGNDGNELSSATVDALCVHRVENAASYSSK